MILHVLKIHILHNDMDLFPNTLIAVSEEQGERFHQDIQLMNYRHQRLWNASTMADSC